jgi:hypothetical protein
VLQWDFTRAEDSGGVFMFVWEVLGRRVLLSGEGLLCLVSVFLEVKGICLLCYLLLR